MRRRQEPSANRPMDKGCSTEPVTLSVSDIGTGRGFDTMTLPETVFTEVLSLFNRTETELPHSIASQSNFLQETAVKNP